MMPILTSVRWHLIVGGFFKIYVFIYYLSYYLTVVGLCCCMWAFFSCVCVCVIWNDGILFSWAPKSLQMVTAAMKLKRHLLLGRKAMTT